MATVTVSQTRSCSKCTCLLDRSGREFVSDGIVGGIFDVFLLLFFIQRRARCYFCIPVLEFPHCCNKYDPLRPSTTLYVSRTLSTSTFTCPSAALGSTYDVTRAEYYFCACARVRVRVRVRVRAKSTLFMAMMATRGG